MEKIIFNKIIKLLNKANKKGEVPVAAIIVFNNKIIAESYNKREKYNNVLGHAEIICIKKAAKKLNTWKLDKCTIYISLEPCSMCKKIIQEARIKNVIYLNNKSENKKEYNQTKYHKYENLKYEMEIKKIMNNFFEKKRKKTNVCNKKV